MILIYPNDPILYYLLLRGLSFLRFDACGLSISLTVSILFFAMGLVIASLAILGFVYVSLIPSLTIFSVVVTNGFLEDMVLMPDFIFQVFYKSKVILPENCNSCISFAHNIPLRVIKFQ